MVVPSTGLTMMAVLSLDFVLVFVGVLVGGGCEKAGLVGEEVVMVVTEVDDAMPITNGPPIGSSVCAAGSGVMTVEADRSLQ